MIVLPWNDLALLERVFSNHGREIAAVITEPIMLNWGAIEPRPGYLEGIRCLCDEHGGLFIMDEVITGFRVRVGGAQELYGVMPDLTTVAKTLGGGLVAGAVAGKARYMERLADGSTYQGGTMNSNPVSMASTLAFLNAIGADGGAELEKAHAAARSLMEGMRELARETSLPLNVRGVPGVVFTSFLPEDAEPIVDFRSSLQADLAAAERLRRELHKRGIRMTERGIWFVSTTHTLQDVETTLEAVAGALAAMSHEELEYVHSFRGDFGRG